MKLSGSRAAISFAAAALCACTTTDTLASYRPVVDPARTNAAKFERDLGACRAIAKQLEADYAKRQQEEIAKNVLIGILVGAAAGAAIGDSGDFVAAGAASGAAAGIVAPGEYGPDFVKYGPRRVVDRCMADRGHNILNDAGRG